MEVTGTHYHTGGTAKIHGSDVSLQLTYLDHSQWRAENTFLFVISVLKCVCVCVLDNGSSSQCSYPGVTVIAKLLLAFEM